MTRLYISGGMTGYQGFNFDAFNYVEKQLLVAGYEVENPADKGIIEGWAWEDYLKYDIGVLIQCDGVALLPGWQDSRGARFEVDIADRLAITTKSWDLWVTPRKGLV